LRGGEKHRALLEECLARGQKLGFSEVRTPPEQARRLRVLAVEEQASVLAAEEARTGLKLNGLLLLRARTVLGKWAQELMRCSELLTTFVEAGGGLAAFWVYEKRETNKLESGGQMCGQRGAVEDDVGGDKDCEGCGQQYVVRTGFTGVRAAVGVKGNSLVKWNDARDGRSVTVVREKLLALGLCRWEAFAEKHQKDKRVFNKWFQISGAAATQAEPLAPPTTRQLAALIWQLYAELAAAALG
jgi:hypothetical protein